MELDPPTDLLTSVLIHSRISSASVRSLCYFFPSTFKLHPEKGHWRQISAKEAQVAKHNDAIRKVHEELENVLQQQEALLRADRVNRINSFASNPALHELQKQLAITRKKVERLQARYKQQVSVGRGLREMHAIGVLLPA